jgi:hypothetical protein
VGAAHRGHVTVEGHFCTQIPATTRNPVSDVRDQNGRKLDK